MGLSAIVSSSASSASSASVTSLLSPVGIGVGGVFVAIALVLLLAYYDVLGASEADNATHAELRRTLVVTIIPLLFAFGGVVLFKTLQLL